jgi:hypothetical protein
MSEPCVVTKAPFEAMSSEVVNYRELEPLLIRDGILLLRKDE